MAVAVAVGIATGLAWNWRLSNLPSPTLTVEPFTRQSLELLSQPLRPIEVDGSFADAAAEVAAAASEAGVVIEVRYDDLHLRGTVNGVGGSTLKPEEQPVRLFLRSPTLREAVEALAHQHGDSGGLAWWTESDPAAGGLRVVLTGRERGHPPTVSRVYDIADLLEDAAAWSSHFRLPVPGAWTEFVTIVDHPDTPQGQTMAMREMLTSFIALQTWQVAGTGSASGYGHWSVDRNWLIIRHTPESHRRVELLLAALRADAHDLEGTPWQANADQ